MVSSSEKGGDILFWRAFSSSENTRMVIYMANMTSAPDTRLETFFSECVAELDYAAHCLAIIPDVSFVTAEWWSVYPICIVLCRTEFLAQVLRCLFLSL